MMNEPSSTERVVRRHLQAFLEQKGVTAILDDYDEKACLLSEDKTYCGKHEIQDFFERFMEGLPPQAIDSFALKGLRVAGEVALITWTIGPALPLGTDTFVVREGRIVSQTFAMYAAPTP